METSPVPMAYYEYQNGEWFPLIITDGLCREFDSDRETLRRQFDGSAFDGLHPDDVGRVMRVCDEFARGIAGCDIVYRRRSDKDGTYHKIHSMGHWHTMPDGVKLAVFTYTDFTDSIKEIGELASAYDFFREDLFYNDPMTELPNVNYLKQFADTRVEKIRKAGRTPVVLFMDVNGMHAYNSRYGITRGDELMQLIADVLNDEFADSLIVRGADDHFLLIAPMDSKEDLIHKIQETNQKVREGAYGHINGIRTGVAVCEEGIKNAEVQERARRAHKWIGTDMNLTCRFYSEQMDKEYRTRTYILENFDRALEQGWIQVFYQGIMRLSSGKVAALEALARWVDPERGMLSPGEFIPVLEKHHLLHRLDLYMVEQVCREIPLRDQLGMPLQPVSINFSAQDFDYIDVVQEINRITDAFDLHKYGLSRRDFIIEITEQDIATATERFQEQLKKLKDNGYRIWVDDFGSGYSSLNVFGQYDFDLIKIDMDLLRHLDDNSGTNRHIIQAIVKLARELGVHTLTEGMETEEQMVFLSKVGCELGQGFYYAKPAPLTEMISRREQGIQMLPCETPEERESYSAEWMDK